MTVSENPHIRMFQGDCMEAMAGMEDNAYELAIVDPPYGIGYEKGGQYFNDNEDKNWDRSIPKAKYFEQLYRVSKNQIIWGGNYFFLNPCRCFLIWYKTDELKGRTFSECEYAWTSFNKPARHFELKPFQRNGTRIHPTQKPVALYKWLLTNYATEGDKILDTHGGSGSIAIACYDMGFDLDWYELDKDYYDAAVDRFNKHKQQGQLFRPKPTQEAVQTKIEL